jgi:hypothetical protein
MQVDWHGGGNFRRSTMRGSPNELGAICLLSWEDESTLLAIAKYMQSLSDRMHLWCPSNIEFIRP